MQKILQYMEQRSFSLVVRQSNDRDDVWYAEVGPGSDHRQWPTVGTVEGWGRTPAIALANLEANLP